MVRKETQMQPLHPHATTIVPWEEVQEKREKERRSDGANHDGPKCPLEVSIL